MAAIILTWDEGGDVNIVKDESGKNRMFDSIESADSWSWSNTAQIGDYQKIIDLDE